MATVPNNPYMSDIYSVFGAPSGTLLTAFIRGGAYVPNIPQNSNVPTSLPISMSQLAGATNYVPMTVSVAGSGGTTFINEPAPASATVSGGLLATVSNGTGNYTYQWSLVSFTGGASALTWGTNNGGRGISCYATVYKNTIATARFRLTVSDGVNTVQNEYNRTLRYWTDL